MKKVIFIFSFVLFIMLMANVEDIIKMINNEDLLYYFDDTDTMYKLKRGEYKIEGYNTHKYIVFLDTAKTLKRIIPIKRGDKVLEGTYIGIANVFYEHFFDDSALKYFKKSFEEFNNKDAYYKYIKLYANMDKEDLIYELKSFEEKYPNNKNVLLSNALVYFEHGYKDNSILCLRKGTAEYDTSNAFLNMLILRMFRDKEYSHKELKKAMKYALENFKHKPNLYYIIDYINDKKEENKYFNLDKYIFEVLKDKNAHFENKITSAVYFVNAGKHYNEALDVLYELLDNKDYKELKPLIHFYIAKVEYEKKHYKRALEHIEEIEDTTGMNKDYYDLKLKIDLKVADKEKITNDIIKLLSLDPYDEDVLKIVKKRYNSDYDNIMKGVMNYIGSSVDTFDVDALLCYNFDNDTVNLINKEGIILLDLFATWCGYCNKSVPIIKSIYENIDSIEIMAITKEQDKKLLREYIKTKGIEYNVYIDINTMNKLNESAIPVFYVINPKTKEFFRYLGYSDDLYNWLKSRIAYFYGAF